MTGPLVDFGKVDYMDFYKRVGIVCNRIPQGNVATYGQIALLCGKPKNSRQVGYALKMGLAGDIPAYRVVNARGILSGAFHFEMPDLQKLLLAEDGRPVDYAMVWDQPHSEADYPGDVIAWIEEIMAD